MAFLRCQETATKHQKAKRLRNRMAGSHLVNYFQNNKNGRGQRNAISGNQPKSRDPASYPFSPGPPGRTKKLKTPLTPHMIPCLLLANPLLRGIRRLAKDSGRGLWRLCRLGRWSWRWRRLTRCSGKQNTPQPVRPNLRKSRFTPLVPFCPCRFFFVFVFKQKMVV